TAERYWYAYNSTVDGNVTIGFSSPATSGPVTFFSDTFPSSTSSFAFEESAPLASKMGLTFNEDATEVWTVADTGPYEPLYKYRNVGGVWQQDPLWAPPQGNPTRPAYEDQGGPMAYDNENDLLFVLGMQL